MMDIINTPSMYIYVCCICQTVLRHIFLNFLPEFISLEKEVAKKRPFSRN